MLHSATPHPNKYDHAYALNILIFYFIIFYFKKLEAHISLSLEYHFTVHIVQTFKALMPCNQNPLKRAFSSSIP